MSVAPVPLQAGLLAPLGLLALLAAVPIVVLYLIRPDPRRVDLPTLRFLAEDRGTDATTPLLERLRRNALLILQILVVVLLAVSLATPYVTVSRGQAAEETVLVVDASASMTTETGDGTRFQRALASAREAVTATTSVVLAADRPRVLVRGGGRAEATRALEGLTPTETAGDLRAAIAQASVVAGSDDRIVVLSDFAGESAWQSEVAAARAAGVVVDLRQFAGGTNAAGIVGRSFSGANVTFEVRSYADTPIRRTVTLGTAQASVRLRPGDIVEVTLPVPDGGGRARLSPGDDFAADDVAPVVAPEDQTVDVLLLTNDRNRYLAAALEVIDVVNLAVIRPPAAISGRYDAVIYSNLRQDRLLTSNVALGRDTVESGGGVAIQAQQEMPDYGDLLLVEPQGVGTSPAVTGVASDPLVAGLSFPPPSEYVVGDLRSGRALVSTANRTPLIATEERGDGRILYYGYIEDASPFKFDVQYPVFWKRAVFYLAGRRPLSESNRQTGTQLTFENETTVQTPTGQRETRRLLLDQVGVYDTPQGRYGVALYSGSESNVTAPSLSGGSGGPLGDRVETEDRPVPRPLDGPVALAALLVVLGELVWLRRRGDI
ncbi:MAG: BatA and WFA domain-containing protein [Haloferacaceae archaeon]